MNDAPAKKKKNKSSGIKGFFSSGGSSGHHEEGKKDRFTKEREERDRRNGAQGDDEFRDDFEREINGGARRAPTDNPGGGAQLVDVDSATVDNDGLHHTF